MYHTTESFLVYSGMHVCGQSVLWGFKWVVCVSLNATSAMMIFMQNIA